MSQQWRKTVPEQMGGSGERPSVSISGVHWIWHTVIGDPFILLGGAVSSVLCICVPLSSFPGQLRLPLSVPLCSILLLTVVAFDTDKKSTSALSWHAHCAQCPALHPPCAIRVDATASLHPTLPPRPVRPLFFRPCPPPWGSPLSCACSRTPIEFLGPRLYPGPTHSYPCSVWGRLLNNRNRYWHTRLSLLV